jgi:signal transduction histidine kinase/DNA-binding response OmpR family regulator
MAIPLKVLFVEDRPSDAELMLYELRQAGFGPIWSRVDTEHDFRLALESPPEVILADYTLPQFNVFHALEIVRGQELDLPFIIVTGTIGEEVAVECIKQGADDYLLKDRLARLGPAVRQALEAKQARMERRKAEETRIQLIREQAARAAAEAAQQRLAFLSEASAVLTSSLDYQAMLQRLAHLAAPYLADCCIIDIIQDDGTIRRMAIAHADPEWTDVADTLHRHPPRPDSDDPIAKVLRTGEPELVTMIPEHRIEKPVNGSDEETHVLYVLRPTSYLILPLTVRGKTIGAISLILTTSPRQHTPVTVALAEELARRSATAVDNARLYEQAQEAIRLRDEFLASISHDLKNPLGAIKGQAQLLQRRVKREHPSATERLVKGLTTIDSLATKMTAQIDELLDLASLQAGQQLELNRQPTDLVALAQRVAEECQQITEQVELRVDVMVPELVGNWDQVRLARVLSNLFENAIKYSPHQTTVTVVVKEEERAGNTWAILEVRDQGIGIPESELTRIFERFYRASNAAGQRKGTGLGLASSHQIVEQHGGTITVHSRIGEGSTFTVYLPIIPTSSGETAMITPSAEHPSTPSD